MNDPILLPGDVFLTRGTGFLSAAIRFLTRGIGEKRTLVNHVGIIVKVVWKKAVEAIEALNAVEAVETRKYCGHLPNGRHSL